VNGKKIILYGDKMTLHELSAEELLKEYEKYYPRKKEIWLEIKHRLKKLEGIEDRGVYCPRCKGWIIGKYQRR